MRKYILLLVLLIAAGMLLNQPLLAGTTGKIAGKVSDKESGDFLPGANIIVIAKIEKGVEVPLDRTLGAASNLDGDYVILNVPPGKYKVQAMFIGYERVIVSNVSVSIDVTTKVDFPMSLSTLQLGEVEIVAERAIVQKDLTSSQAHVSSETIENLPVVEVRDVIGLQAGVSVDRGGGIHIRGGRSSEVAYYVDGVSVTDVYNGASAVKVENESVQELQVISGTFNAEYGQAMSGIVNIVTKDGASSYSGNLMIYGGDYYSTKKDKVSKQDLYLDLDNISPFATKNYQGTLSGPVPGFGDKLTFFATGRFYKTDGWLNGYRVFDTNGNTLATFGENHEILDAEVVPMNTRESLTGQFKLTYKLSNALRLRGSFFISDEENQNYEHGFQWLPDARTTNYDDGYNAGLQLTHTLSSNAFYTLNVTRFHKQFENYLYENPLDPRYLHPDSLVESNYNFNNSGTQLGFFSRSTDTWVGKFDLTYQLNIVHQLKIGAEGKTHKLYEEGFGQQPKLDENGVEISPFVPIIPSIETNSHNIYTVKPREFSAYIQDKIEYESVIVNVGLRFDYFNSKGLLLKDPGDPNVYQPLRADNQALSLEERLNKWYKSPSAKYQLSPRVGISYPITDRGVIHFSYGHFLQIPSFNLLYQNPGFKVPAASGNFGIYGNADLNPQKTVMYELGLKQQLGPDIGIDITGFYRDVRDWVGVGPQIETVGSGGQILAGRTYSIYENQDYANIRGITVSVNQVRSSTFNYSFDYTFEVAEGSNSDPGEEFGRRNNGSEPTRFIVPLGWDQTHKLNASLIFTSGGWGASLIGRYHTGEPYTPSVGVATRVGQNLNLAFARNSRTKPYFLGFDLRLTRRFTFGSYDIEFFLNGFNIFDRLNELDVYSDSGRSDISSTFPQVRGTTINNNTADQFLRQPFRYGPAREFQWGFKLNL